MTGNNEIILCPAEMHAAIQHYFDTVLFREGQAPKVTSVEASGNSFRVVVTKPTARPSEPTVATIKTHLGALAPRQDVPWPLPEAPPPRWTDC